MPVRVPLFHYRTSSQNKMEQFTRTQSAFYMYYYLLMTMTVLLFGVTQGQTWRPGYCPCTCSMASGPQLTLALGPGTYRQVDCRYQNLKSVPLHIPPDTAVLLLGNNNIKSVLPEHLANLRELVYLDLSHNYVGQVMDGTFQDNVNLRYVSLSWNELLTVGDSAFPSPSHVTRLLLSGNKLGIVPPAVKTLTSLVVADLANNGILQIPGDAFAGLAHLQFINLRSNLVQRIGDGAFADLPALVNLQLSQNSISSVIPNAFHNLTRLTTVSLGYNNFISLPANQFINIPSLHAINLEGNQITRLPPSIFQPLNNLQEINLENNGLEMVPTSLFLNRDTLQKVYLAGNDPAPPMSSHLFTNLSNLVSLSLSQLPEPFLGLPEQLTELRISDTAITSIPQNYFQHLPNLESLILSENTIARIYRGAFSGLGKLRHLDLSGNAIPSIPAWLFEGNISSSLETLSLQENRIGQIDPYALRSLVSLESLFLEANRLQEVLPDTFPDSVEYIQLGENPLRYLDVDSVRSLPALRLFAADSRNLHCDCLLQHFVEWVRENQVIVDGASDMLCRTPANLRGRSILRLNSRQLGCIPPRISTLPRVQNISVDVGGDITLPCSLVPSAVAMLKWETAGRNRVTMSNYLRTSYEIDQMQLLPTGTLNVMDVNAMDAGTYTCTASNPSGSDVISYTVVINQLRMTTPRIIPVSNDTRETGNKTITSPTDQSSVNGTDPVTPLTGTVVPPPGVTVPPTWTRGPGNESTSTTANMSSRPIITTGAPGWPVSTSAQRPGSRVTIGDVPLEGLPNAGEGQGGSNTGAGRGTSGQGTSTTKWIQPRGGSAVTINPTIGRYPVSDGPNIPSGDPRNPGGSSSPGGPTIPVGPNGPSGPNNPNDPQNPCNPNPCLHRGICKVMTLDDGDVDDTIEPDESYSDSQGNVPETGVYTAPPIVVRAHCTCRKRFGGPTCEIRKPETPVKVIVLKALSGVISLSWDQENNGNIDGYRILYALAGDEGMTKTVPIHPDVKSFTVEELKEGSTYRICVVSFNEGGDSPIGDQNCIWAETPSDMHPLESLITTEYGIIGGGILFVILLTLLTAVCYARGKKERDYERRVVVPRVTQSVADLPASNVFRRSLKPPDSSFYQDDMMLLDFSKNGERKMYMNPFDARQSIMLAENEHISPPLGFGEGIPSSLLPNNRRTLRIQEDQV